METYGTLTEIVNQNVYDRTEAGFTITITKTCAWADRDTYTPAIGTAHPTATAYTLSTAKQEQQKGGLCQITLTYFAANDSLPAKTAVEQTSQIEVPIQEHPDFASWAADWDSENQRFLASSDKAGITSYIKGSTTVTVTEYFSSKPASPFEDVGTLDSPGADYGSADNWLVIGATRQKVGNYWTVERVHLYSAVPYNPDVYP